jgi:hypothetical protein
MTAGEINPDLFMVARQNFRSNDTIFEAADIDLIMRRGSIIAHKLFALMRTPLLAKFLELALEEDDSWANQLVSRIGGVIDDKPPITWEIDITETDAPAVFDRLQTGEPVQLNNIYKDPQNRKQQLPCIPILIRRKKSQHLMLPDEHLQIETGDEILFCGNQKAYSMTDWLILNPHVFNYILTGEEHPSGYLWSLLTRHRQKKNMRQQIR